MTGAGRDPFARYLDLMAAVGFKPSTTLGQNFLLDPTLHRVIADAAAPGPQDLVLEIGVGLGFLTRELAPRCARLLGLEIDARLFGIARDELAPFANVELVHADALGGPGGTLHPVAVTALAQWPGRALVIANLPYAVSGPLLAELSCQPRRPERMVLLVQKELAQRLQAGPGTKDYGSLSALLQNLFAVRVLRDVPPQVFRPRPKVTSAILALDALPSPLAPGEAGPFARFLRTLFQQRRKTLRSTLPPAAAAGGRAAPELPADEAKQRAESLDPTALLALWRRCPAPG